MEKHYVNFFRALSITAASGVVFFTQATLAAIPFDDDLVPAELVKDITGSDVYRGVPDDFPLPVVPLDGNPAIRLLGSQVSALNQVLYLRTSEDGMAIRDGLVRAYTASGWTDLSTTPDVGIQAIDVGLPLYTRLCHDEIGTLSIDMNGTSNGENRITVSFRPVIPFGLPTGMSCEEQKAYIDAGYSGGLLAYFQGQLPLLENPEGTSAQFGGGIIGSRLFSISSFNSGNSYETGQSGTISVSDMTLADLHRHFTAQLRDQGWRSDSESIGSASTSSVWHKSLPGPDVPGVEINGDFNLRGSMTVISVGNDEYHIMFRMFSF